MSIYLHIPYCKKLCYYCDFHFSVNLKTKQEFVAALCKELELQKDFLTTQKIETIYFGGGTPSVLSKEEIAQILHTIQNYFPISETAEITFECNPDDLNKEYLQDLFSLGINRLSIGIQSFFDDDLVTLNRRHNCQEAQNCIQLAQQVGFTNITIDLIYGLPNQTLERWKQNLEIVSQLNIQHLSAYALTVEKSTALHKFVNTGKIKIPQDEQVISHFEYLVEWSQKQGFEQYEISNFARNGMYSKHNSNYWKGIPYLGVGPSAHSFNGTHRFWNISHNQKYIQSIQEGIVPREAEELSLSDKYNEYIMTGLRTKWGVEIEFIKTNFPNDFYCNFTELITKYISQDLMKKTETHVFFTTKGFMLSDSIISELFKIDE